MWTIELYALVHLHKRSLVVFERTIRHRPTPEVHQASATNGKALTAGTNSSTERNYAASHLSQPYFLND